MGLIFVASSEYLNFISIVENSHFNACAFLPEELEWDLLEIAYLQYISY